jgi:mandelamide amidase
VQTALDIASGTKTSAEAVSECLAAIDANDLGAFINLDKSRLIAQAKAQAADDVRAAGKPLGRLHGVPLVIKDNIHVAGLPNTACTPALKDFVPTVSAPVVALLEKEGAIVLGKTTLHELAYGITSSHPVGGPFPTALNAVDKTRIPGGSSGGTGCAIAGGQAPAGLGTDTGGSGRIPAALNVVYGLRPTNASASGVHRYPGEAITPISHTRDTPAPFAAYAEDIALIDSIITGEAVPDPIDLQGLKLAKPMFYWAGLDQETESVCNAAISKLEAAGCEIVEVDFDVDELNQKVSFCICFCETKVDLPKYLETYCPGITYDDVVAKLANPDVIGAFSGINAPAFTAAQYEEVMSVTRPALQAKYVEAFMGCDAFIMPTTKEPACTIEEGRTRETVFPDFIRNCDPISNAGFPGITIPAGKTSGGLPVGLEFDGPPDSDRKLISIALATQGMFE